MQMRMLVATFPLIVSLSIPASAESPAQVVPATHEELGRALDDLVGQIQGLGDRWRGQFSGGQTPAERPLISIMLSHRQELGLSPAQVQDLERLRTDFQREVIKREADLRVAEMDLAALLRSDPVDVARAEAKVREEERVRADLRIGRIRTIEQGKAKLTPEQRGKLASLIAEPAAAQPRTDTGMPRALVPQSL